jgi:hypothetical protein
MSAKDELKLLLDAVPDITEPDTWWPLGADHPEYRKGAIWIETWWRAQLTKIIEEQSE